jgi:hypothetical protein
MRPALLALFILLASTLSAQHKSINQFIRHHNNGAENISFTIPGFLIGLAGEIGMIAAGDEEEKAAFSLAQLLGTTRFLIFDSNDFDTDEDIRRLLSELEGEHHYERWASIRAATGEQIELTVQMKGKRVCDIVAIVKDAEEHQTVFLHAKTNFTAAELGEIMNELSK